MTLSMADLCVLAVAAYHSESDFIIKEINWKRVICLYHNEKKSCVCTDKVSWACLLIDRIDAIRKISLEVF